jgi:quinol monooxygenase YgiN
VLLEEYADGAARERHRATAHFRTLVLDRAVPLLHHRDVDAYEELGAVP